MLNKKSAYSYHTTPEIKEIQNDISWNQNPE